MNLSPSGIGLGFLVAGTLAAPFANAQDPMGPGYATNSVIANGVLNQTRGAVQVNMAAGDGNLQANGGALAIGANSLALVRLIQNPGPGDANPSLDATSRIGGRAFHDARGWLAINQTSGQRNTQANGMAVTMGIRGQVVSESELAQVGNLQEQVQAGSEHPGSGRRAVTIAPTAFEGASGLIQVNQSAGNRNATRNRFALEVDLGPGAK